MPGSQTRTTSPPWPPSPPSGPPRGTCASRRKEIQPLPPAPPSTHTFALSSIPKSVTAGRPGSVAHADRDLELVAGDGDAQPVERRPGRALHPQPQFGRVGGAAAERAETLTFAGAQRPL